MGTIAQKLTYLEDTKTAIGNAIAAKGGSVTGKTFRQYATEISNLPSGGGGTPIAVSKDVSDYTGGATFNFRAQLTDVNWPSGITTIEGFASCTGLTSLTIPSTVTTIGNSAFASCTGLTSLTIPSTVTSIGTYAFNDCTGLTSLTIPSSVTTIPSNAFSNCTGLTSLTIPQGISSINSSAFQDCTGLTSLTLPEGISGIYNKAFQGCTGLTSIVCLATAPPTLSADAFTNTNNCPIYVPAESVNAYKSATNWSNLASRIQAIPE